MWKIIRKKVLFLASRAGSPFPQEDIGKASEGLVYLVQHHLGDVCGCGYTFIYVNCRKEPKLYSSARLDLTPDRRQ